MTDKWTEDKVRDIERMTAALPEYDPDQMEYVRKKVSLKERIKRWLIGFGLYQHLF